jgi:hypothetical protein
VQAVTLCKRQISAPLFCWVGDGYSIVGSGSSAPLYLLDHLHFSCLNLSHPGFEKTKPNALYVCLRYLNHTYINNMVNKYDILIKLQVKNLTEYP